MERKLVKFNANEWVYVKLTDRGKAIEMQDILDNYKQYKIMGKPRPEDEQGRTRWQLWGLMQMFGPHIELTAEPCFDMEIELEVWENA